MKKGEHTVTLFFVPRAGIEPARHLSVTGF